MFVLRRRQASEIEMTGRKIDLMRWLVLTADKDWFSRMVV